MSEHSKDLEKGFLNAQYKSQSIGDYSGKYQLLQLRSQIGDFKDDRKVCIQAFRIRQQPDIGAEGPSHGQLSRFRLTQWFWDQVFGQERIPCTGSVIPKGNSREPVWSTATCDTGQSRRICC